jgi:hypothetical protein
VAISLGANKVQPTSTAVLFLESKCMLDLAKLEGGEIVVLIAATVVSPQYVQRFLVAAPGDKPSCVKHR